MSERPWWVHAVQWGLWLVVMTAVMRWLGKSRRPAEQKGDGSVLAYPKSFVILGFLCTGFFGLMALLSGLATKPGARWVPILFCAFIPLGLVMLGEGLLVHHKLSAAGIEYRGWLRRHPLVRWDELQTAQWSPSMKWLVVRTSDGRKLHFSAMLSGLQTLAIALDERAPHLKLDHDTAIMLADARSGVLPSVWG